MSATDANLRSQAKTISLRSRLLFALFVGLGLFLVERVWSVRHLQQETLAFAEGRALDMALRGQMAFEQDVGSARTVVSLLADQRAELTDPARCRALFDEALAAAPNILHLSRIDSHGTVRCSTLEPSIGQNYADRPHVKVPLNSGTWYVSDVIVGKIIPEPTIFVSLPMFDENGETEGLLTARLDLAWLSRFLDDNARFSANHTLLIDSSGTYVARFPESARPDADSGFEAAVGNLVTHQTQGSAELMDGERPVLVGYTRLALNNAHLAIVMDTGEALGSTTTALRNTVVAFSVLLAVVAFGVGFGSHRYIVGPIQTISASLESLGREPATHSDFVVTGIRELEPIETARDRMVERLASRERSLREVNSQLTALSVTDPLTQIANRRGFEAYFETVWASATETGRALGLVILDVDHFKAYNDLRGHMAGDQCLREIAATLAGEVRAERDLLCRLGGEEFAVLLPNAEVHHIEHIAFRLRKAVEARALAHPATASGVVTVSVGYASCVPAEGGEPADLMRNADAALYGAKHAGRNSVCGYKADAA